MKLQDLKIVVSGAASGMGRHFSMRLVEAGKLLGIAVLDHVRHVSGNAE